MPRPDPVLTLKLTKDGTTTRVLVRVQISPGPSGYEAFDYVDIPPERDQEIDATALHSQTALHDFLTTLLRTDGQETAVWILQPRLPRLRALLEAPLDKPEIDVPL